MKKTITMLSALVFLFAITSYAQLLLEENFDYPAGDSLTSHGWTGHSGGTTNAQTIVAPGLEYAGYLSSGIGNAASLTTTGQDVNRQFSDSVTSGTVYASFLASVTSAQTAGDYFFHLGPKTLSTVFMGRVFVKLASNGNLSFGLSKTTTSTSIPPVYTDSIYTTGNTYLLVVKYQFNAGANDDVLSLFINPALDATEPSPVLVHDTSTTNDPLSIGTVALRQGTASNAPNVIVDGIRISTAWTDVVPVELVSFNAAANGSGINLTWMTASETNNNGFSIERRSNSSDWNAVGFVKGNGTTTQANNYSFTDKNVTSQTAYSYRLKQIDFDGSFAYSKTVQVTSNSIVNTFELKQNYPNPFNPATQISFSIAKDGFVKLVVYNLLGQEVKTLINRNMEAGSHSVSFNASDLQSGIYIYKLTSAGSTLTKKMMLVK
ncbi:MAG: T9SS type A sorting domain-containing protein [Ignavibacteriaceae bacterium]|nr:T9SS type A sorting domain-containing protein [Ignavibacteriaceae bacterium]